MSKFLSRRFVIVVLSLIAYGLSAAFPERAALIQEIAPLISAIVIVGLFSFGAEDAIKAWQSGKASSAEDAIRKITAEVLDSAFAKQNDPLVSVGDAPKG